MTDDEYERYVNNFYDQFPDAEDNDWLEAMDDCVEDAVLPSLDGTLEYRTGEVIELLCSRRLTVFDLEGYGINILEERKML